MKLQITSFPVILVLVGLTQIMGFPQEVRPQPRQDDGEDAAAAGGQTLVGVGNLVATIFKGIADLPLTTINAVLKPWQPTPAPAVKAKPAAAQAAAGQQIVVVQQPQVAEQQPQQQPQYPGLGVPLPGFTTAAPVTAPPPAPEETSIDPEAEDEDEDGKDKEKEEGAAQPQPQQQQQAVGVAAAAAVTAAPATEPPAETTPIAEDGDDEADDRLEYSLQA